MQDIVFYVDASKTIGTVTNITNNGNGFAPPLVFGVSVCLRMRIFATSMTADAYPISSFSDVTRWAWRMDSEFNRRTPYKVNADNANISVRTVTENVNGKPMHFTEFAIPISDMNTQELEDWLGDNKEQPAELTGELVGYDSSGNAIFGLQVDGFVMRNKLADRKEPTSIEQGYLTSSETELLVSSAVMTKQDKLTSANAGAGIAIDSGGTISMACAVLGATNGVQLVNGIAQFDVATAPAADGATAGLIKMVGDGLLVNGGTAHIDDASVEDVLVGIEGGTASINDEVVTPGNLRGALSFGQAVDVACCPDMSPGRDEEAPATLQFTGDSTQYTRAELLALNDTSRFLKPFTYRYPNAGTDNHAVGFNGNLKRFPKFAKDLLYILIADVRNVSTTKQLRSAAAVGYGDLKSRLGDPAGVVPGVPRTVEYIPAGDTSWHRVAVLFGSTTDSSGGAFIQSKLTSDGLMEVEFSNFRQYEVTALTDEAIMMLAAYGQELNPETGVPVGPDAFFRSASVYSIRDKYLVKQDMVCPFIPTISMPDNSDLTVAAGLSYKIKYTNDNPHIITGDTIPVDGYGWDTHVQMFIKGTSSVVFQQPLILMDALTPNAGHNLSIKWRNGQALVYVDDTNAGYIVVTASGTDNGSLNFGIVDPGTDYVIFAPALDGTTVDAGTAIFGSTTTDLTTLNVLGNGTDKTTITGTIGTASGKTINFQSLAIDGGTLSGAGTQNLDDVTLLNTTLGSGTMLYDVEIPEGSTVTGDFIRAGDGAVVTGAGIIDMSEAGSNRFIYGNAATISGVTIANADNSNIGAVLRASSGGIVSATDATFQYNHTVSSGGVAYVGSAASACFTSCSFIGNSGGAGGVVAGRFTGSFAEFTSCSFTDNSCTGRGGAINAIDTATMVFSSCTFSNNSAGISAKDILVGTATVSVNGCTFSELLCSAGTDPTEVSYANLAGSNRISTYFKAYNGSHTMDLNIESGTVVDLTGNTYTNVLYAGKGNIAVNGAMTIITSDGTSATLGAVNCNLITNTAKVSGDLSIIPADADPWEATNITFASPLDASAAGTVKLSGTTFTSAAMISGTPSRIQLPAATTVSFSGNTNAADTKILEAPVILVGDDAAAPSGSATVVNASGASSTVSGIGTYIDKEGDNDFVALSNVTSVTTSDGLAAALTGANRWVKVKNGLVTSASYPEGGTVTDKRIITAEYELVLGGNFSFSGGAVVTVDEAAKKTAIAGGETVMSSVEIPSGATVKVNGGILDIGHVNGNGGTIELAGSNAFRMTSGTIGRVVISSGAIVDLTSSIVPGDGIALYGGTSLSPTTIVCGGRSRIFEDVEIRGTTISNQGIIYGATVYSKVGDDHYVYYTENDGATSSSVIVTGQTEYVVPGGLMQVSGT